VEFDAAVAELEQLIATLERDGDERALLLLQLVDAIHRPAMERIAARDLEHPLVQAVLAMYGTPDDPELLAEEALDEVRPYIESHGGEVELLGVEGGVVRVKLQGACVGCAGSAITLKRGIEEALRQHMPGFTDVVAEELPAVTGVALPMAPSGALEAMRRPVFVEVAEDAGLAEGELRVVDAEGIPVLLARHQGEVYAVRNGCAVDGLPLEGSRLTDAGVLVCPWHNCAYDIRSGVRVDDEDGRLTVVPIAIRDGAIKVAVNVA
jgi:Fe-S cluster biogenesis protein NfuA/nitrite reductase/ring-hydroxylating ferredoxin subunit